VVQRIRKHSAEWQGLKKRIYRNSTKNLTNKQMSQDHVDDLVHIARNDASSFGKLVRIARFWRHSERKVGEQ